MKKETVSKIRAVYKFFGSIFFPLPVTIFDRKFKIEIMKIEAIWNPIEVIDGSIIVASLQEQIQISW